MGSSVRRRRPACRFTPRPDRDDTGWASARRNEEPPLWFRHAEQARHGENLRDRSLRTTDSARSTRNSGRIVVYAFFRTPGIRPFRRTSVPLRTGSNTPSRATSTLDEIGSHLHATGYLAARNHHLATGRRLKSRLCWICGREPGRCAAPTVQPRLESVALDGSSARSATVAASMPHAPWISRPPL